MPEMHPPTRWVRTNKEASMSDWAAEKAMKSKKLNGNAKLVHLALAWDADDDGITAVVTHEDIAAFLGIGVTTVGASLKRLQDLRFIERVEHVPNVGTKYALAREVA
jgi:Helix-turn-helix domain